MSETSGTLDSDTRHHIACELTHDIRNLDGWQDRIRWNNRAMMLALNTITELEATIESLRVSHLLELGKLEAKLAQFRDAYTTAITFADQAFQGKDAILPDFAKLGDCKFAAIVELANKYKALQAECQQLHELVNCDTGRLPWGRD